MVVVDDKERKTSYPAVKELKNWSVEVERALTNQWRLSEQWRFNPKGKKKIYSIDTPPPYVNSPIHIGQAVTYCYMDFFARFQRMKNFEVIFPLGLDRNGLPIELAAEKKFDVSPFSIGREKFIALCEQLINKSSDDTMDTFSKLGISFTSYQQGDHIGSVYHTDSPSYRALTQATFINLYKKGLVYEDTRINNWDSKLQTTVADAEIDYKELPSTFNDVAWSVKETGEQIVIATTRPELICSCGMVIYHPTDTRYQHLEGKHALSPIFKKAVPIQAHPLADPAKGSGLVMMCSAGDLTDIQFFREMNLKPVIAITKEGRMNPHAGVLEGLKVKEARKKILELLKEKGLLLAQKQIMHRTPVSERTGVEIEFIEMPEFYLKQLVFKKDIKQIMQKIEFYPPEARKILEAWLDSITIDWPISRRRYYATPIPLWYSGAMVAVPKTGTYYQPWKETPPLDASVLAAGKEIGKVKDFRGVVWKGEERVFDTWMDSSISELYILGYQQHDAFFTKAYPASLRPQGKEIIRTWLYYTILRGYLETKKACFKDVWINQHIVDESGRKMSKSVGNVIDPQVLLKEYGAEAIRLWAAIEGDLAKQDLKCSSDKIRAETKTLHKLLNVTKFILQFERPKKATLSALDQLFIDYIQDLTGFSEKSYEAYDFHHPALRLRHFLWEVFASHYIEMVKNRAYNQAGQFTASERDSARYTLYYLLERLLVLFYPIIPQISSVLLHALDTAPNSFPTAHKGKSNLALIDQLVAFNSEIWKMKKDKGLTLRDPLGSASIPPALKTFERDLKACHTLG